MTLNALIQAAATVLDCDTELDSLKTTSEKIRYLDAKGTSRAEIAKQLGVRYQHVRNVLLKPLKQVTK